MLTGRCPHAPVSCLTMYMVRLAIQVKNVFSKARFLVLGLVNRKKAMVKRFAISPLSANLDYWQS